MKFPQQMMSASRWMIHHREATDDNETKQPESVHTTKPDGYIGDGWTRTRWAQACQWVDYDTANDYLLTHRNADHLCFVLRDLEPGEKTRFICFDFDNCFDELGRLDHSVADFVNEVDSFAERSKNGRGLHVVAEYYGPPLKTKNAVPFGNCKVDVITSGQIVATGDIYEDEKPFDGWATIDLAILKTRFGLKVKMVEGRQVGDCWTLEFDKTPDDKQYLASNMYEWEPCISGHGGDKEFFKAACHLARHGVTGEAARECLSYIQAQPPFTDAETTHKIESAFVRVHDDGEFDTFSHGRRSAKSEFGAVDQPDTDKGTADIAGVDSLPTLEGMNDAEIAFYRATGFAGLELTRHFEIFAPANMPNFIIRDLMFETGALMIGGQNKTFKTTIGLDLVVSLATGRSFLNEFEIECATKNIAIFSSETQDYLMTQYLGTVLVAKGLTPSDFRKSFTINSTVPPFVMQNDGRMKRNLRFEQYLQDKKPDVVLFDPLYRMFLGVNQADISSMGQALEFVELTCTRYGAMPIFCHHSRKPTTMQGAEFPVMTLNDLSGAGGGAFCRQWLLLSHTRRYVNGSGRLNVCIGASGADEHQWIIDIETYDDDRNRVWQPKAFKLNLLEELIHRLQTDGPLTIRQLAGRLKASENAIETVADKLEADGRVEQLQNKIGLVSQQTGTVEL